MHKTTPFLWFDDKAEEAMNFYVSILRIQKLEALPDMGTQARDRRGR
jgi:predicted 3-demethylubiquinone-9 3-methyltransferase (glyoxalase superfamily)